MDKSCNLNKDCTAAGIHAQTPDQYNACTKPQQAPETVDGCKRSSEFKTRMTTNKHDFRDQGTPHRWHGHQGISYSGSHFHIPFSPPPPNHRSDPRVGYPELGRKFARRNEKHITQTIFILSELPLSGACRPDDNSRRFFLDIRYAAAAHPPVGHRSVIVCILRPPWVCILHVFIIAS
jgi:hypothetical protein